MTTLAAMILALAALQAGPIDRAKLERIRSMSPEERARLKARLERFRSLPEEERARLRENLQRIKSMTPEKVRQLRRKAMEIPEQQRRKLGEVARGFNRWFRGRLAFEGFPRGAFFTWLRIRKPERVEEVRSKMGEASVFPGLMLEFRRATSTRTRGHLKSHGCSPPSALEALRRKPPAEFWKGIQELHRTCPSRSGSTSPARRPR